MIYQIVIETPSTLDVLDVDGNGDYVIGNSIVGELATMQAEWANVSCDDGGHMMAGTLVDAGRKVIHALIATDADDPLPLLEALIAGYGLGWVVWGMCSLFKQTPVDANGDRQTDINGDPLPDEQVVELAIAPEFVKFLPDVVTHDIDGNELTRTRPLVVGQLHSWDGGEPLAVETGV